MIIKQHINTIINTNKAPKPLGPYAQGINTGDFIFVSGQIGICPDTKIIPENVYDQTYQSLQNIRNIIKTIKLEVINIVKTTIFIIDINDISKINTSYKKFFAEHTINYNNIYLPARSCVEVNKLPKNVKIEIEAIAKYF